MVCKKQAFFLYLLLGIFQNIDADQTSKILFDSSSYQRVVHENGYKVTIDLSTQILGLDIKAIRNTGRLYPTLSDVLSKNNDFASASLFRTKAKQFDDGLYASIELLCQQGTEKCIGKTAFLKKVIEILTPQSIEKNRENSSVKKSREFLSIAAEFGGSTEYKNRSLSSDIVQMKQEFIANERQSKPIGFYTWSKELSQIFQQDRFLQTNLNDKNIVDRFELVKNIRNAIKTKKEVCDAYVYYLSFISKLTNPFPPEYQDLTQVSETINNYESVCFFPPSQSHETELIKKAYGHKHIPESFSLIDSLILCIQKKNIDLAPRKNSGWYDYQTYGLEPFIIPDRMPESKHLFLSPAYKQELENVFKGFVALMRETHIKQLELPVAALSIKPLQVRERKTIVIYPELTVEPVVSFYLRQAQAYQYIQKLLLETFGETTLKSTYRKTSDSIVAAPLFTELESMKSLFLGAYQIAATQLGMEIDPALYSKKAEKEHDFFFAQHWIKTLVNDRDLSTDTRMMVPVFYDFERKKTKVWIFMGYSSKPLSVFFKQNPAYSFQKPSIDTGEPVVNFEATTKLLIYPVSGEIYVTKILNRSEFRNLCDKERTPDNIVKLLQNQ